MKTEIMITGGSAVMMLEIKKSFYALAHKERFNGRCWLLEYPTKREAKEAIKKAVEYFHEYDEEPGYFDKETLIYDTGKATILEK